MTYEQDLEARYAAFLALNECIELTVQPDGSTAYNFGAGPEARDLGWSAFCAVLDAAIDVTIVCWPEVVVTLLSKRTR